MSGNPVPQELIEDSWFPFAGDITIKPFEAPVIPEPPRPGEGGVDCKECARADDDYLWTDDTWRLSAYTESPFPGIVLLKPREHMDSFSDMTPELLTALGPMIKRLEGVLLSLGNIARVHVLRWGDGSEHFHLWFMPRPLGAMQLRGSMLPVWLDLLPPLSEAELQPVLDRIAAGMRDSA